MGMIGEKIRELRNKRITRNPSLLMILKLVTALLVPLLLILILSFLYSYRQAMNQSAERVSSMLEYQVEEVNATFGQINDYLLDMLISNPNADQIRRSTQNDVDFYRAARNMCSDVEGLQNFINGGYTFYFYTPRLNLSFRSSGKTESYLTDYKVVDAVRMEIDEGNYIYNDTSWKFYDVDGCGYMVQVLVYEGMYFCCWIRTELIFSFLDDMTQSGNGFYSLVNRYGEPLTSVERFESMEVNVQSGQVECDKRGYEANIVYPSYMSVGIVVVDREFLGLDDAGVYVLLVLVAFLIVLSISIYVIHYFRQYIQQPLESFQNHVSSYVQEKKNSRQHGFAELSQMEDAFGVLEEQVRALKIDVYEQKLSRTRTELEYLQNQIKPHFFVNCFSIIHGMAERRQYDRIQELCLILSGYVRYLLTGSFKKVPLSRELEQIGDFLNIQNIRFHTENSMDSDVDEDLLDCLIPPVTLLTFVENTVKHNKFKRDDLCVTVSAEEVISGNEHRLRMKVADNGIGLSTEALAKSQELLAAIRKAMLMDGPQPDNENNGEHIGLGNVYRRLLMFYGNRADMDIVSNTGIGTVVTMTIPIEREEPPQKGMLPPRRL